MEMESNISLGGTIILLALFAQKYIFGPRFRNKVLVNMFFPRLKMLLKRLGALDID